VVFTGLFRVTVSGCRYGWLQGFCAGGFGGLASGFMLVYKTTCRRKAGYRTLLLHKKPEWWAGNRVSFWF